METAEKKAMVAGEKPAKNAFISYHPELRGMGTQGMARVPQRMFPDGWQAKPSKQAANPTNGHKLENGSAGRHKERYDRKDRCGYAKGTYRHCGRPQAFLSHDTYVARHVTDGEREYGSACCGKCKHHLRVWGARVWACDNAMSEKHGFPTDYGNTCAFFEREDLDRR